MSLFQRIETKMELRAYQERTRQKVHEGFKQFKRQLIVVPTGGGKTIIFSALASDYAVEAKRTLILAHRDELIDQAIDKLWKSTGIEAEKEKADDYATLDSTVVVGSVQTLMREKRLQRWPADHFSLVVVDEAHRILADSYQTVLTRFHDHANVLGVTATPDRGDKRNLGKYLENLADEVSLFDLIHAGYLSRIVTKTVPIRIDLSGVRVEKGDYDVNDLDGAIMRYLHEIAAAVRSEAPFRKILIFLPLVKTSLAMRDACRAAGMAAEHIDGESKDRKEILNAFNENKFDVLCNSMLLTEGYDQPDVDCVIVLRPTKVRSLYSQMIGRGTRIATGKDHLLLLDFLWMHERHDLIKPAHLISKSDKTADIMMNIAEKGGAFDLEELQLAANEEIEKKAEEESEAKRQREEKLMQSIRENSGKGKRMFDAMEFAVSLHDPELLDYEPEMPWEAEEPSEKQLIAIGRLGIDPGSITSKGLATKILGRAYVRREQKLATPKQLGILRKFKHPHAELVTFEDASKLIDGYFGSSRNRPSFQRVS